MGKFDSVPQHIVTSFDKGLIHRVQQEGSLLMNTVRMETDVVGDSHTFNRLGAIKAQKDDVRHGDTVLQDIEHDVRIAFIVPSNTALALDKKDDAKMLIDPTNKYTEAQHMALGVEVDIEIITALNGIAKQGRKAQTDVPFLPANIVAIDVDDPGTPSGMNVFKARRAKRFMDAFKVKKIDRFMLITAFQLENMLAELEATSKDFVEVEKLVDGEITRFLGFNWIVIEELPVASDIRDCLAYQKQMLGFAWNRQISTDIGPRRDKKVLKQIFSEMDIGAVRIQEEGVVRILCDES